MTRMTSHGGRRSRSADLYGDKDASLLFREAHEIELYHLAAGTQILQFIYAAPTNFVHVSDFDQSLGVYPLECSVRQRDIQKKMAPENSSRLPRGPLERLIKSPETVFRENRPACR